MEKRIRVDFWRVSVGSEENRSFDEILQSARKVPLEKRSRGYSNEDPILLNEIEKNGEFWFGDMMKVRMDYLPPKAKVTGGIKPLGLEDDEGIGEEMAFMYCPRFSLLVTQRNHYGVSASAFQVYLYELLNLSDAVRFEPVIRADVLKRLQGMREVRKFNVGFAGVTNPSLLNVQGKALTDVINLLEIFGGCNAQISVSMGNFDGTLNLRTIHDFVKRAFAFATGKSKVTKLEVAGTDSEGLKTVFDVLDYRLTKENIIVIKRDRQLTYNKRKATIASAYEDAKDEVSQLFRPENE
jgi:hypothetical protein